MEADGERESLSTQSEKGQRESSETEIKGKGESFQTSCPNSEACYECETIR